MQGSAPMPQAPIHELIPLQKSRGGRNVVSARVLWQFLGVGTEFAKWFTRRVEEYGFKAGEDYSSFVAESTGGRPAEEFAITLDMAKELAMVERNDQGQQARRYFIDCERKLRELVQGPALILPTTYKEALKQLIEKEEQREAMEQQLALAAPKVAFYEAVAVSTNCVPMRAAANVLKIPGVGRNKLFEMLRVDGILSKNNQPLATYIKQGYFEVELKTYEPGPKGEKGAKGTRLANTTRVTPKGLGWLQKRYKPAA